MKNRDDYVKNLKSKLDQWNADLDTLEDKARGAAEDAKAAYRGRIDDARKRRDEARQKLTEIESAGEDAWEELKKGTEDAWDRLADGVKKAKEAIV